MDADNLSRMTRGWFVGDFSPTTFATRNVEVGVKDIASHIPEYPAKKVKTEAELRIELREKFGDKPWGKLMLDGIFAW